MHLQFIKVNIKLTQPFISMYFIIEQSDVCMFCCVLSSFVPCFYFPVVVCNAESALNFKIGVSVYIEYRVGQHIGSRLWFHLHRHVDFAL